MTVSKQITYRIRPRQQDNGSIDCPDWWMDGDHNSRPLVVVRQSGTRRAGWPWSRYDRPVWRLVGSATALPEALDIMRADALDQLAKYRQEVDAADIRATFEPLTMTAVLELGGTSDSDRLRFI